MNSRTRTTVMTAQIAFSPIPLESGFSKYNIDTNVIEMPTFTACMTFLGSFRPRFHNTLTASLKKSVAFPTKVLKNACVFFIILSASSFLQHTFFVSGFKVFISNEGTLTKMRRVCNAQERPDHIKGLDLCACCYFI